ncbi:MAG: hypothetical protein ACE5M4_07675 [Anaerolineales bacterium]
MRSAKVAAAIVVMLLLSACGGAPAQTTPTTIAPPDPTSAFSDPTHAPLDLSEAPTAVIDPTPEAAVDFENDLEEFDPDQFDRPTKIDNQWFPLQPGTQYVYEGITEEGSRRIPHSIVFSVTDLTKEIAGIRTVVAWILDYSDQELVEAELAFYAQDNHGNVWFLGEYPEVYERGKLVEAPSWITGFKGARAGIVMKAEPEVGLPSYSQGWGPAVNWTDRGQVVQTGQRTCVLVDCYENVLVTEEFSQSEPDAFQIKFYAPGVGNVRVGWRGADATREELELVDLILLDPQALEEIRAGALELEKRAYEISKEVYDQTPPAE